LLYEMSITLGYAYEKSHIQQGVYYPQSYSDSENENVEIRRLWLAVLKGDRQFPMRAEVFASPQVPVMPPAQQKQPVQTGKTADEAPPAVVS